jgi:phage shock protein PspC (stress-responsive transcriptional regulator)
MTSEMTLFGVFVQPLLVYFVLSLCLLAVLRRVLAGLGAYRFLWHKPLVDVALLVIILAGITEFWPRWVP